MAIDEPPEAALEDSEQREKVRDAIAALLEAHLAPSRQLTIYCAVDGTGFLPLMYLSYHARYRS